MGKAYTRWRRSPGLFDTVLVGIDGTGSSDDSSYASAYQHSFVNEIYDRSRVKNKYYFRGPSLLGFERKALKTILDATLSGGQSFANPRRKFKILLMGWSRGGAACIHIAKELQRYNIDVKAMLLFDPVDRDLALSTGRVPNNVKDALTIVRRPETGSWESFGYAIDNIDFNNTSRYQHSSNHSIVTIFGTHAAIGGVVGPKEGYAAVETRGQGKLYMGDASMADPYGISRDYVQAKAYFGQENDMHVKMLTSHVSFDDDLKARKLVKHEIKGFLSKHGYV